MSKRKGKREGERKMEGERGQGGKNEKERAKGAREKKNRGRGEFLLLRGIVHLLVQNFYLSRI